MKTAMIILLIVSTTQKEVPTREIVLGGGCFWCTEALFKQLNGVLEVTSGYSGGDRINPDYQSVCSGETGHAEVVRVRYNPEVIPLETLLEVFFFSHDPTSLNQQGADIGSQYRSVIFYTVPEQEPTINHAIKKLNESGKYPKKVVTEVLPFKNFYPAESYHQNYYNRNPNVPYCKFLIKPKLDKLNKSFAPNAIK